MTEEIYALLTIWGLMLAGAAPSLWDDLKLWWRNR